jgi:plastocyanin
MRSPFSLVIPLALSSTILVGCGGSSGDPGPSAQTVSSITLSAPSNDPMLSLGDTRTITAVAKDASGATINAPALSWSSNAPSVATIAGTGASATITSVGNGTATITASSGSVQNSITVTVAQRATAIALSGMPASLPPGARVQLSALARDGKQRVVSGVSGFTYSSSDGSVAVVDGSGLVTAISLGSATISGSATVNGVAITGSTPVSVSFGTVNPTSASVAASNDNSFSPSSVTIAPGGSVTWSFGSVQHNVQFRGGTGVPSSIGNSASTQASRTFESAGTFDYECTLHGGMNGTVVVQGSSNTPAFVALLNGANERPNPVTTNGRGFASFTQSGGTVSYVVTFSGLTAPPIMAHIHGPGNASQAVGVLVDFPTTGQTINNGVLTGTFTAASIRAAAGQPAISLDSLLTLMRNGNAYVNVHTPLNPGGEIRGQIGVP